MGNNQTCAHIENTHTLWLRTTNKRRRLMSSFRTTQAKQWKHPYPYLNNPTHNVPSLPPTIVLRQWFRPASASSSCSSSPLFFWCCGRSKSSRVEVRRASSTLLQPQVLAWPNSNSADSWFVATDDAARQSVPPSQSRNRHLYPLGLMGPVLPI